MRASHFLCALLGVVEISTSSASFLDLSPDFESFSTISAVEPQSKIIRIPFDRRKRFHGLDASPDAARIRRREAKGKTLLQQLDNKDYLFYANVTIGTPPQPLRLHIDTGSSDIWVEYARSGLCQQPRNPCKNSGVYDNGTSSTYKYLSSDFSIRYVDREYATGDYGQETFGVAGVSVSGLQFGIGIDATSEEGIMGVGFRGNEAQTAVGKKPYQNLVYLMKEQGYINTEAYSLWLNDLDASTGEILFGGIDTEKYKGNLTTVPIDKRSATAEATEFVITLTGISLSNSAGDSRTVFDQSSSVGIAVLLDSGASFSYLPTAIARQLTEAIGAVYDSNFGGSILDCGRKNINGTINFTFSGVTIRVPIDEFIVDATTSSGNTYINPATGKQVCYFGILGTDQAGISTLGDTFLRSAYVVYDLANEEISLGQTVYNTTASNVLEIKAGKDGVPDAEGASMAVTIAATATSYPGGVFSTVQSSLSGTALQGSTVTRTAAATTITAGFESKKSSAFAHHIAMPNSDSILFGAFLWILAFFI